MAIPLKFPCHCEERSDVAIPLKFPCHCQERSDVAIRIRKTLGIYRNLSEKGCNLEKMLLK